MKILLLITSITSFCFISCKDPFELPAPPEKQSLLVVEGYINGQGPTTIQLSRTVPLNNETVLKPELEAAVKVESNNGLSINLTDGGDGKYIVSSLLLSPDERYRIHIKTKNNKEYVSEYVVYKPTPSIDELTWEKKPDGLQILLNTHDVQNNTRYYRWNYEETWEFNSVSRSVFEWSKTLQDVVRRNPVENVYTCWRTESSKRILLGSSAKLQNDLITNYPLQFIQDTSWKLAIRYSMLVKQYALTEAAFQYWQLMAKNTEQLGSVFDAQPSELRGNIRSVTDPNEAVIGYISAGTIEEKRIFITQQEVPGWGSNLKHCIIDSVKNHKDSLRVRLGSGVAVPLDLNAAQDRYFLTSKECADCRERGTNIKPSFW